MLLKVEGMTCGHCVAAVTQAVQAVDAAAEVAAAVGRPRKDVYRMALAMQEERDDDDHAVD